MWEPVPGFVYFLIMKKLASPERDFGLVKIGITRGDVLRRVATLQTGNPYDLACYAVVETSWPREVEHFVHRSHSPDMHSDEWLRCSEGELAELVQRTRTIATQVAERKLKEHTLTSCASNGETRRATLEEFRLHREARKVLNELVPSRLRLSAFRARLQAATGQSRGIPGVVAVKYIPAGLRFSTPLAARRFPALVARCQTQDVSGTFHWRGVPRASHFTAEKGFAQAEESSARAAEHEALLAGRPLHGWAERTAALVESHAVFLEELRRVHLLQAALAEIRTDLIVAMGATEALEPVCSFRRGSAAKMDAQLFIQQYPDEAAQCVTRRAPALRKAVYPSRSYL